MGTEVRLELGYDPVGHATRGDEAIRMVGELRPDLVLMDIQLAGVMDGIAAAQAIRTRFALPVVFLTAFRTAHRVSSTPRTSGSSRAPRQREVLQLIAEGQSTKEIARHLDLSAKTVESHRSQLMKQLDIHEVAGLVRYAMHIGLVTSGLQPAPVSGLFHGMPECPMPARSAII